ncbi:hypothetical protein CROQUDRAFT_92811 [Cronartium quercuum f. sp. fusiforme G11]|uniref:Uncharacterized protein n=1 Tax=Cronartium quercuum f. sp. fusiforme G11 TaxID=708437 RepID=A0A9P6TC64_9BASI|nr:hypothetical protein CROQUDRAFT_92811 [Cronartium quercuum f. sp. fusiforme G11]
MGDIKSVFQELVAMLKVLPTGGFMAMSLVVNKAVHLNLPTGKFNCNKVTFEDAITLAEHGLQLVSQPDLLLANPPNLILATVLVGVQAVEVKINSLMLDMANQAALPLHATIVCASCLARG